MSGFREPVRLKRCCHGSGGSRSLRRKEEGVACAFITLSCRPLFRRFRIRHPPRHQRRGTEPGACNPHRSPGRGTDRAVRHPPTVPRRPARFRCSDRLGMRACRRDVGLSCRCFRESIAFPAECSLQLFWSAILEIEFQNQIWYDFTMAEVLEE